MSGIPPGARSGDHLGSRSGGRDEGARRPDAMPLWAGPRVVRAGARIPCNRTIASSPQARIVLAELRLYPEGWLIEVEAEAHTVGESPGDLIARCTAEPLDGPADSLLRFGVRFRDSGEAATTDYVLTPASEPEPPVLLTLGGPGYHIDGMNIRSEENLWLWPAPPAETFDFTVEWPAFGIPLTTTTIDGGRFRDSATGSQ
ncbi:hypothetical protein [Amycolatopsis sp. NPDC054798]